MKNRILLSTLLLLSVIAIGTQSVLAATTASQTITGTLGQRKQVVANGGNIAAIIDPDTGALSAAFTPAFRLTTNTNASQSVRMTSLCSATGGAQNAFFGDGNSTTTFIVLTNNTVLPTVADVNNAKGVTPVPANNPNVIVYAITKPADVPGDLVYTWDNPNQYYNAALTNKGNTDTLLTVPASTPRTDTYSFDDEPGSYQADVTLSFV